MKIYKPKKLSKDDIEFIDTWGSLGRVDDFVYAVLRVGLECPLDIEGCDDDVCDDAFWIEWFDKQYYRMINFDRFAARMALKILEFNKDILQQNGFKYELIDISGLTSKLKEKLDDIWDFVKLVKKEV